MATITTKFSVGDIVYHASTTTVLKRHPCPDCNGVGKWKATSPAGGEYEFSCPRCSASYNSEHDLMLDYSAFVPFVGRLTIGSIQFNTAKGCYDEGARYMCLETGVGSGSVYDEARLFETEDEATKAAQVMADEQNVSVSWVAKLYDKTLRISDYQLEKLTSDDVRSARLMAFTHTNEQIATKFGVATSTISYAITGKNWSHLAGAVSESERHQQTAGKAMT